MNVLPMSWHVTDGDFSLDQRATDAVESLRLKKEQKGWYHNIVWYLPWREGRERGTSRVQQGDTKVDIQVQEFPSLFLLLR